MATWRRFGVVVAGVLATIGVLAVPAAAEPRLEAGGGVGQAWVTGATPGAQVRLVTAGGAEAGLGAVDRLGSFLVRDLDPGRYRFETSGTGADVVVTGEDDRPPVSLYEGQTLHEGLNYIRMRDGVTLAATVRLPWGRKLSDGPFPTVIEYSGYAAAAPGDPLLGAASGAVRKPVADTPVASVILGTTVAPQLLGFASVIVQMRGSGCSGGDFGLFDRQAAADGYDAVEIAGRQSWVAGGKVGMVGVSFSGISQMYVAGLRPPHLAAITPMSTTDDLYSTGMPGGMFNRGFANSWLKQRLEHAAPAPAGGQKWAIEQIRRGDRVCRDNQRLRLQTQDPFEVVRANPLRSASVYRQRSIPELTEKIDVPVFIAGTSADEQTGSQWTNLLRLFDGKRDVWINVINGPHPDSMGPQILARWAEFLQIFVAGRPPRPQGAGAELGRGLAFMTMAPAQEIPPLRFTDAPDAATAARFRAETPRVWALYENGAGKAGPGGSSSRWQRSFDAWPPREVVPTRLFTAPGGRLQSRVSPGELAFRPDPATRPPSMFREVRRTVESWGPHPAYDWRRPPGRSGAGFLGAPLAADTVLLGPGSVDLRIRASAPVVDLQATLTEVAPGGVETHVATGVLRSSFRRPAAGTTELDMRPDFTVAEPLPAGFTTLRIPLPTVQHAFRKGSRIRLVLSAPGGDLSAWQFDTPAGGTDVVVDLAGSSVVLPVLDGVAPAGPQPLCGFLRGHPCRPYVPAFNDG